MEPFHPCLDVRVLFADASKEDAVELWQWQPQFFRAIHPISTRDGSAIDGNNDVIYFKFESNAVRYPDLGSGDALVNMLAGLDCDAAAL